MNKVTFEEIARNPHGWVYCPRGVKWTNTGEIIPCAEAVALGATNIRPNPDIQSVGCIADWPAVPSVVPRDEFLSSMQSLLETLPPGSKVRVDFPAGFWTPGGEAGSYTGYVNTGSDGRVQYAGDLV